MSCGRQRWTRLISLSAAFAFLIVAFPAAARDAAFVEPGSSAGLVNANEAIRVEPKGEIDIGDSSLNIARRTTLFFVNQSGGPVKIEKLAVNSDSNVTAEISNDDCTKEGTLTSTSRCSVEVSITPNSSGTWSVEVLMTHNGAGRITRAKITGKTAGGAAGDKKDSGLFLSTKDIKSVDFGEVEVGEGKTVRSALMVNDSPEAITLYSIDVIEAENGLERLDQGCTVDMELKPGESCPVTLVWTPTTQGHVSTDLIIRHSGRLGFAVIPIRGTTKGGDMAGAGNQSKDMKADATKGNSIPLPPGKNDMDRMTDKISPIAASALSSAPPGALHLIGTVGSRGVFYKPDGTTAVAQAGDEIDMGDDTVKVISVTARSAEVMLHGKKKQLTLETAQALMEKARAMSTKESVSNLPPLQMPGESKTTSIVPLPAPAPTSNMSGTLGYTGAK